MPEFNPIKSLEDAGLLSPVPTSHDAEGHGALAARRALSTLNPQEVEVLKSIRERVAAELAQDVEAHNNTNGTICW